MELPDAFKRDLKYLLNTYNIDSLTDTPDFLLVTYICNTLSAYKDLSDKMKKVLSR